MTARLRSCALEPTLALTTTESSGFATQGRGRKFSDGILPQPVQPCLGELQRVPAFAAPYRRSPVIGHYLDADARSCGIVNFPLVGRSLVQS